MGYRTTALKGPKALCGSVLWPAMADRDAAVTASGSRKTDCEHEMDANDGQKHKSPRVARNCDTLLRVVGWKFGKCAAAEQSLLELRPSVLRFSGPYPSECGFIRRGSRLTHRRPRASLFAPDFSTLVADGAWWWSVRVGTVTCQTVRLLACYEE